MKVLQKQISDHILSRYDRSLSVCKNPTPLGVGVSEGITGFSQDAIILEVRRFGDFEKN